MSFINKIITLIMILSAMTSCDRNEENFDLNYWLSGDSFPNTTAVEYLNPNPNATLVFKLSDLMDTSKVNELVVWKWGKDTVINNDTLYLLRCDTKGLDIIIPDILLFSDEDSWMYRYVKGYRYTMYHLFYAFNQVDSTYYTPGIGNHKFMYSYRSPVQIGNFQGYNRNQIHSRIDSIADFGDVGKQVDFTFTHTFGITEIVLKKLFYGVGQPKTVECYKLERVG